MYRPSALPVTEPETKPADPFTLPALIAWLRTKPADEKYSYIKSSSCLLTQYFESAGGKNLLGFRYADRHGNILSMWTHPEFFMIARADSFGAALARAEAML